MRSFLLAFFRIVDRRIKGRREETRDRIKKIKERKEKKSVSFEKVREYTRSV